jgi:hypothetical protein
MKERESERKKLEVGTITTTETVLEVYGIERRLIAQDFV